MKKTGSTLWTLDSTGLIWESPESELRGIKRIYYSIILPAIIRPTLGGIKE
jgi:hypothetical protein